MKLTLRSDFWDFYDHHFDIVGKPFYRFAKSQVNRTRSQDLKILEDCGFAVPLNAPVKTFTYLSVDGPYVIYDDETQHCGEGKRLVYNLEFENPNKLCTIYIPSNITYHVRHLAIGDFKCVLRYESNHEWMSNCGNVEIEIIQYGIYNFPPLESIQKYLKHPLIAVDGKYNINGDFCVFDLNTAPQLRGTGLERILSPQQVVQFIKEWFKHEEDLSRM